MEHAAIDVPVERETRPAGVAASTLAIALLGLAAIGVLLLPAFLGLPAPAGVALMIAGLGALVVAARRCARSSERIAWPTIAVCLTIAVIVLLLGGEGRLLSASTDWRVRDAVLADIAYHPWPFHYALPDGPALLRAPLGMYLLPSMAGRLGQNALDLALLTTNTLTLGLLLALGSTLFAPGKPRQIATWTLFLFSGFDAIGTLAMRWAGHPAPLVHIENWAPGSQFTAPWNQITWAPQHAIAGWACALFFLLWQQRKLPIGFLAAAVPLFAFWSPVAAAGALPFALLAAVKERRGIRLADCVLAAVAVAIAAPALLYEHAGAASVGGGWNPLSPGLYALVIALEILPLTLPLLLGREPSRFGHDTLLLALAMMLFAPLWKIGIWKDFQMRITIVPLIVTAAAFADALIRARDDGSRGRHRLLLAILATGALTIVPEFVPVLTMRAAPAPRCTVVNAWMRDPVEARYGPPNTYVAPVRALPAFMQAAPRAIVDPAKDPADCLGRAWFTPAWIG